MSKAWRYCHGRARFGFRGERRHHVLHDVLTQSPRARQRGRRLRNQLRFNENWPIRRNVVGSLSRCRARRGAEHRARHQAGAARVVLPEQPTHQLTGGTQPGDRLSRLVENASLTIDLQTAERKGDATGHGISLERVAARWRSPSWSCRSRGLAWYARL